MKAKDFSHSSFLLPLFVLYHLIPQALKQNVKCFVLLLQIRNECYISECVHSVFLLNVIPRLEMGVVFTCTLSTIIIAKSGRQHLVYFSLTDIGRKVTLSLFVPLPGGKYHIKICPMLSPIWFYFFQDFLFFQYEHQKLQIFYSFSGDN